MCKRLHINRPLFLSDFDETWIFLAVSEKAQISSFIKIHPMGAKLFHADGQTDEHDEGNSHFSQFCAHA
jgi:hypothetical protein